MSYKQLFVWLFCLIASIFTGCVPLILIIASIPKIDIDGKRAKGKNERLQQTCKRKTPRCL